MSALPFGLLYLVTANATILLAVAKGRIRRLVLDNRSQFHNYWLNTLYGEDTVRCFFHASEGTHIGTRSKPHATWKTSALISQRGVEIKYLTRIKYYEILDISILLEPLFVTFPKATESGWLKGPTSPVAIDFLFIMRTLYCLGRSTSTRRSDDYK